MTNSEQALREIAEKYLPIKGYEFAIDKYSLLKVEEHNNFLSDLTALLEQHKEVILRGELEKFGTYFNEIRCPYVVTSVIDEYLKSREK